MAEFAERPSVRVWVGFFSMTMLKEDSTHPSISQSMWGKPLEMLISKSLTKEKISRSTKIKRNFKNTGEGAMQNSTWFLIVELILVCNPEGERNPFLCPFLLKRIGNTIGNRKQVRRKRSCMTTTCNRKTGWKLSE